MSLPVFKKLQIKPKSFVLVLHAPSKIDDMFGAPPEGISLKTDLGGSFDVVVAFYKRKADVESEVDALIEAMGDGLLWISYPKGTSKVETDLNKDILRVGLEKRGLKAVSLISIDDVWSSMRLKKI